MKKILSIIVIIVSLTACDDNFLDRQPLDSFGSESVFNDPALTNAYLYNLIGRLPWGLNGGSAGYCDNNSTLASCTDEARGKSGWVKPSNVIRVGGITPTNDGGLGLWNSAYTTIRVANEIIAGLEDSGLDESKKKVVVASARYVRAFTYWDLARRYKDVPLIVVPQSATDELLVSKTSQKEVYDFIYAELNEIAVDLPNKSTVVGGTINKQAAIALNSRVMLYAKEWQKAADLADRIISGADNDGVNLDPDYSKVFQSHHGNIEVIMEKVTNVPNTGHGFSFYNFPVRWRTAWGGQTDPTQEMVNAYEMAATGLPITDPASGYNPARPYDGRDSRFYASVFYHGSEFGVAPNTGEPFIDMEFNNGNEGPGTNNYNGNASITGYLVRKYVNPADGANVQDDQNTNSWKEIRFAEVLLNYAEAANEASGPSLAVYNAMNRVRLRAGLPDLPGGLSKEQMRDRIRQERRVELAFENFRWFDLIRWGTAKDVLDGYIPHGVKITRKAGAPTKAEKDQLFDTDLLNFDTSFIVNGRNQTFPDSHYLMPIPQSEIDINANLLPQNPGYN